SFLEKLSDVKVRKKIPYYEYVAKNIGVRRDRGEFILAANPDILMDPAIIQKIAKHQLSADCYYRVNRADYLKGLDQIDPAEDLQKIRSRVFRFFLKGFTYTIEPGTFSTLKTILLYLKNRARLFYEFRIIPFEKLVNKFDIQVKYNNIEFNMHCNCSGDFIMMHNRAWAKLKGHPEGTYLPMHTDAFTVATAYFSGITEVVFFEPVYHQDHGRRFTADNSDADIFAAYMKFEEDGRQMQKMGKAIIYNDDNWGSVNEVFEEETLK
ncbi:MAG: hypothetical protein JWO06_1706, partial [Bacteroidota bacterium]|nr:hypothetical protein [Bacteroidota bacterium]